MEIKKIFILTFLLILIIVGIVLLSNHQMVGNVIKSSKQENQVLLKTTKGDITIELYENSPITTENFKNLVKKGTYNGVIFHRVIPDFMIQGGDPTGTGRGDPSIPSIQDEFIKGNSNLRGTISMANRGPNTGSSQFFINLKDNTFLDFDKPPMQSKHPVFGKVIKGMDVVDQIAQVQTQNDKPLEDVKILEAKVL